LYLQVDHCDQVRIALPALTHKGAADFQQGRYASKNCGSVLFMRQMAKIGQGVVVCVRQHSRRPLGGCAGHRKIIGRRNQMGLSL